MVHKYLQPSQATIQGHIHRERQNLQSTKQQSPTVTTLLQHPGTVNLATRELQEDMFPLPNTPNLCTNEVIYILIDKTKDITAFQDLTGRFPVKSRQGNQYILVGYHYIINYIHGIPVKDHTAPVLTKAYETMHKLFSKSGAAPTN